MKVAQLDVCGEICPYPMTATMKKMKSLSPGDQLLITLDYPLGVDSITRWAGREGHKVLRCEKVNESRWEVLLQKV